MTWWASSTLTPFLSAMDSKMISGREEISLWLKAFVHVIYVWKWSQVEKRFHFILKHFFMSFTHDDQKVGGDISEDCRALQLVHSVVLDTSAVFPHYCGLPYRRSLRSLVSSYLKVSIVLKLSFFSPFSSSLEKKSIFCEAPLTNI